MTPCLKCQGTTEEGYMPDFTYGNIAVTSWIAGAPETSIWRGLKLSGKDRIPVTAYRCTQCGFLELYATPA